SSIIGEVLKRSGIDFNRKVNSVSRNERAALLTTIKKFDMLVSSLRTFDEAIITSGGVDVKQINPKTMESKIVKGLYFCGEVLDVDALTGGFNLQIAFATGYAAGNSIKLEEV
ncbi:MAG: NAD(P)/FAD-dependent oxidoreductase, partial [Clostridia bacterium]|nr:NAD(P)/FAD-dependent oxidoreductase [Clostridia bacterium]